MCDSKELVLPDVLHQFGIAAPSKLAVDDIDDDYISEYKKLCKEKYDAYVKYYPEQTAILMEVMGSIGGKFSGLARRFQCEQILTVLYTSRKQFPDCYLRFSVSTYEELSRAMFGVSPTRDALLQLVEENPANGRITTTGQKIADATRVLVSEHAQMVVIAREYVEQSKKTFRLAVNPIKSSYDKKIKKLKKG